MVVGGGWGRVGDGGGMRMADSPSTITFHILSYHTSEQSNSNIHDFAKSVGCSGLWGHFYSYQ